MSFALLFYERYDATTSMMLGDLERNVSIDVDILDRLPAEEGQSGWRACPEQVLDAHLADKHWITQDKLILADLAIVSPLCIPRRRSFRSKHTSTCKDGSHKFVPRHGKSRRLPAPMSYAHSF